MEHSVLEIPCTVRRRLKRFAQKPNEHGRRCHAVLSLWETANHVAEAARRLWNSARRTCSPSAVGGVSGKLVPRYSKCWQPW